MRRSRRCARLRMVSYCTLAHKWRKLSSKHLICKTAFRIPDIFLLKAYHKRFFKNISSLHRASDPCPLKLRLTQHNYFNLSIRHHPTPHLLSTTTYQCQISMSEFPLQSPSPLPSSRRTSPPISSRPSSSTPAQSPSSSWTISRLPWWLHWCSLCPGMRYGWRILATIVSNGATLAYSIERFTVTPNRLASRPLWGVALHFLFL